MPPAVTNPPQPVVNLIALATTVVGLVLTLNLINNHVAQAITGAAVVIIPPAYALGSAIVKVIDRHALAIERRSVRLEAVER